MRSADSMVWGHARLAVCSVTCTNILWLQRRRGLQGACLPGESDLQKFLSFMLEIELLSGDVRAHGLVVCGEIRVFLTEILVCSTACCEGQSLGPSTAGKPLDVVRAESAVAFKMSSQAVPSQPFVVAITG